VNQRVAKELRKTFAYTKPDTHGGYNKEFVGQRLQQILGFGGKDADGQEIATSRLEPVNMYRLVCKDTDRRFYKQIKKIFKLSGKKDPREIKKLLEELYTA